MLPAVICTFSPALHSISLLLPSLLPSPCVLFFGLSPCGAVGGFFRLFFFPVPPLLLIIADTSGPAEGNFGEESVCTGVDAQACARMVNVLSKEVDVLAE
jgi:hypothetical protein